MDYDVARNILDLLKTIDQGIIHLKKQISELRYEDALFMLNDVVEGIISIDEALLVNKEIERAEIDLKLEDIKLAINSIIYSYERKKINEIDGKIQTEFYPVFLSWKEMVENLVLSEINI